MLMLQIAGGVVLGFIALAFFRQLVVLAVLAPFVLYLVGYFMIYGAPWAGMTGNDLLSILAVATLVAAFIAIWRLRPKSTPLPVLGETAPHSSAPRK
jgi:hypothetical protein